MLYNCYISLYMLYNRYKCYITVICPSLDTSIVGLSTHICILKLQSKWCLPESLLKSWLIKC